MNKPYIHVHKKPNMYRLYSYFSSFSPSNSGIFLFQKREWGEGGEAVQMRGHILLKGRRGHIAYLLVILVFIYEEKG